MVQGTPHCVVYLYSVFIAYIYDFSKVVQVADSGASCYMTTNNTSMYSINHPPPGCKVITIGDRRMVRVECIGSRDVVFHGDTDERITLLYVSYVPGLGLGFNLYSLHAVQRIHLIISDASGAHMIGTSVTFPFNSNGSYLRATRLPVRSVGEKMKAQMASCGSYFSVSSFSEYMHHQRFGF